MRLFFLFIFLFFYTCKNNSTKSLFFSKSLNVKYKKFINDVDVYHYDEYGFTDKCERSFFILKRLYTYKITLRKITRGDIKMLADDFQISEDYLILNNFSKDNVSDILLDEIDCSIRKKYRFNELLIGQLDDYIILQNNRIRETLFFIKKCDPVD